MSEAVFEIVILLLFTITVFGQRSETFPEHLPQAHECGTLNTQYYYNQNNLTEIDEFPWMGRVLHRNKTDNKKTLFKCYAVLISKWYVLMNAKCFDFKDVPFGVVLGDWDRANSYKKSDCDDNGQCAPVPKMYAIEEPIIHPNYSSEIRNNDIAMVKLSEPVKYSEFIRPICLPSKDIAQMNFDNQLLEVTGWYLNRSVGYIQAKSLVRVANLKTCELRLKKIYKVHKDNSICAFSCWGDYVFSAGTALMGTTVVNEEPANYYLIGMSVFSENKCSSRNPHVYNRVDRYLHWIYDIIKKDISLILPR